MYRNGRYIASTVNAFRLSRWQAAAERSPRSAAAAIPGRNVAALRQLREKDPSATLLFTRDVAAPTGLR